MDIWLTEHPEPQSFVTHLHPHPHVRAHTLNALLQKIILFHYRFSELK